MFCCTPGVVHDPLHATTRGWLVQGTKQFPACGFSNTVVQILNTTAVPYVTVNVLEDDLLRTGELQLHGRVWGCQRSCKHHPLSVSMPCDQ